jgi:SAM-dependent methyltransferase
MHSDEHDDAAFRTVTRSVFDAHHREQASDERIYERLTGLVTPDYFGVADDFFTTRDVLDAGCGSNANASYAFLRCGARHVHSVDVGDEWMDCARARLGEFGERSSLGSEDVLDLGLGDGSFDFVHCAGVLHHTLDPARGFRELARVTRPGGQLFVTIMANGDGVLYQCINLLRRRYQEDASFRRSVDGLTADTLRAGIEWLLSVKEANEPSTSEEAGVIRGLVDEDLVLTVKDRLQAPTYHEFAFTEEQVRSWYLAAGFGEVRRLTRYTRGFENLRRFLAPLYYHHDHPVARFWFGEGYVQMIGTKGSEA